MSNNIQELIEQKQETLETLTVIARVLQADEANGNETSPRLRALSEKLIENLSALNNHIDAVGASNAR